MGEAKSLRLSVLLFSRPLSTRQLASLQMHHMCLLSKLIMTVVEGMETLFSEQQMHAWIAAAE